MAICSFIESLFRHQWQRACTLFAVSITTSAPQALHLNVHTTSAEAWMSLDPDPMIVPCNRPMSPLMPNASPALSGSHS